MTTRSDNECKGCTASVHVSESQLASLEYEASLNSSALSDGSMSAQAIQELYKERLAICRTCDGFKYGTTCKYCGCLIPLKAKVADATCPYPFEPKWIR
ncbi:DUF6171 family protein [Paenibacillus sp. Marseille-Q4541]|uniref:DUF6171 family protein n=1 Tax=Paenibacillus sp. Marseille-Q4541 TaxID=2831522 RepID=UPI001BADFD1C|nr:DUF6171 family protein [Paenibacillus sp. Marseille-Q4541]